MLWRGLFCGYVWRQCRCAPLCLCQGKKDRKDLALMVQISMRNDFGTCMKMGGLVGGQKKLDKNKDGKITGADFKMLRKKKSKKKGKK